MPKTVVRIQESYDGRTLFYLEVPRIYPQASRMYLLNCRPDQSPFTDMRLGDGSPAHVQEAGDKLYQELCNHPAVGSAIAAALLEQQGGCSPICFRLDDVAVADDLPWEAVRTNAFLALDKRWPIVRMREVTEADPRPVYTLEPPLRLTLVLSAAGSSPQNRAPAAVQWNSIYPTLNNYLAANPGLPVSVTVLAGEKSLADAINNLHQPWIQAGVIADKGSLLDQIQKSHPHILHFFCHGVAEEIPHLRIGSFMDWEAEQEPTIAITARELRQRADPDQNVWLVTLNACESAARSGDARSLANSLVAAGFPAAVGMREPIDVQHAHVLCEFLYPAVLNLIAGVKEGVETEIEWAKALSEARAALLDKCNAVGMPAEAAARGCKVWTIPALYTRREPFSLKRIAASLPRAGLSPAKKKLIEYIQALQQQRTKAAEDYKDLPVATLNAILNDFDNQIAAKTAELSQL